MENEKIATDECNNETTMGENVENKPDRINDKFRESDCQGCGQFPDEFECVECGDRFCSKCVNKDHMKDVHYCLNCEDDVAF